MKQIDSRTMTGNIRCCCYIGYTLRGQHLAAPERGYSVVCDLLPDSGQLEGQVSVLAEQDLIPGILLCVVLSSPGALWNHHVLALWHIQHMILHSLTDSLQIFRVGPPRVFDWVVSRCQWAESRQYTFCIAPLGGRVAGAGAGVHVNFGLQVELRWSNCGVTTLKKIDGVVSLVVCCEY